MLNCTRYFLPAVKSSKTGTSDLLSGRKDNESSLKKFLYDKEKKKSRKDERKVLRVSCGWRTCEAVARSGAFVHSIVLVNWQQRLSVLKKEKENADYAKCEQASMLNRLNADL